MPKTKCVDCGRICWNCRKCHNRTYCEFCNSCNLHGQDEPTPEMIRPPREPVGRLLSAVVSPARETPSVRTAWEGEAPAEPAPADVGNEY